ncbi:MAG: NDP-sugar synthase [bacterium]|nr:NDP-sugar synthase [bacterium]
MRPLSDVIPKPALPLPGGPVVRWPLELAKSAGATQIVVNTWHGAELMRTAAEVAHPEGTALAFSNEPRLLGGAGGLAYARDAGLLGSEGSVLVLNGDCVLNIDLDPLIQRHRKEGDLVTMALLPHLDPRTWSRVVLDADGRVASILPPGEPGAGEVPLLYSGVMVVSRELLKRIPSDVGQIGDRLWVPAREANRLGGAVVTGHWREAGTPETYLETAIALLGDRTHVEDGAEVAKSARVRRSLICVGATVGEGAVVSESVVARGAVIESSARVFRSVVIGRERILSGERVVDGFRVGASQIEG